ncbi:MAG: SDR family NAD(P)-dependent oxidoreductase [Chitinophagaceae bacterium]|nr:MAG: SDR family NAD(P)-dependent oxidoreductase [Chitinophagaceae bacterium]
MPKHVIITGANGNMGSAVVKKFIATDYHVIGVDHSGSHLGFAEGHSNFELHQVALENEDASLEFFQEIASLKGNIDAALLLVGGFAMGDIVTTDAEALRSMFKLNFETVYNSARPLFQHMLNRNYGRMVFVGAKPGLDPAAGKDMIAYALSKSLLFKLAAMLNSTAKGKNVTVTVIAPGTLDTELNRRNMPGADTTGWTRPEEIAELCYGICNGGGKVSVI